MNSWKIASIVHAFELQNRPTEHNRNQNIKMKHSANYAKFLHGNNLNAFWLEELVDKQYKIRLYHISYIYLRIILYSLQDYVQQLSDKERSGKLVEIMALVATNVTIDGEVFDIVDIPAATSKLVENAKKGILGSLDLASLVDDLSKLGTFIRVAYNGVAGNTDLQIKVQRVGYKITKLADKSAVTVHNFKGASKDVLEELKGTYQYLLDGMEEMALETLSLLSNVAEQMAKAAEDLHKEFDTATTDVINALEDTQKAKGMQEDKKVQMKKDQEEFERKRKQVEVLQREAMEAEQKAEEFFHKAQEREDKALESQGNFMNKLSDAFGKVLEVGVAAATLKTEQALQKLSEIGDNSIYKEAMEKASEEKMKHLEDMKQQRDIRRQAVQQCIEFAERIKGCKSDEALAEVAIDALHNSVGALKSLSAIMMNAALFWRQMQKHCEQLSKQDMKDLITTAMKYPEDKRIKVWTSKSFKTKAVQYYSKWVALDDVCGTYMEQIKLTRSDLYSYLEENPTIEQSRDNVRNLAATFKDSLEKAQKDIADKDTEASEEMKMLKQNGQ